MAMIGETAAVFILFFFGNVDSSAYPCMYMYGNLPHSITIDASTDVDETIYQVTVEHTVGGVAAKTVSLQTSVEYFMIDHNDVKVNSCLPAPVSSGVTFSLEIQIDGEELACPSASLTVTVTFGIPDFNIPSEVFVDVDSCTSLEVQQVQFHNDHQCNISFSCFVNTTIGDKEFIFDSGNKIITSATDIDFNLIYGLEITCYDSRAPPHTEDVATAMLNVTFNDLKLCSSTILTTVRTSSVYRSSLALTTSSKPSSTLATFLTAVPTSSEMSRTTSFISTFLTTMPKTPKPSETISTTTAKPDEDNDKGFFDDPANVAIIASVGGVTAMAGMGAVGSLAYSTVCRSKSGQNI